MLALYLEVANLDGVIHVSLFFPMRADNREEPLTGPRSLPYL